MVAELHQRPTTSAGDPLSEKPFRHKITLAAFNTLVLVFVRLGRRNRSALVSAGRSDGWGIDTLNVCRSAGSRDWNHHGRPTV